MRRRSSLEELDIDDEQTQQQQNSSIFEVDSNPPDSRPCITIDNCGIHCWDKVTEGQHGVHDRCLDSQRFHSYEPWNTIDPSDEHRASISVKMSIIHELCGGNTENQDSSPVMLWRNYQNTDDELTSTGARSPSSDPGVTVEDFDPDPEREHEERRTLERFASFPSGRPATPKWNRRNKSKGTDSPRQVVATIQKPIPEEECLAKNPGQGHKQLYFDFTQLHEHGSECEPVTSRGMRPARGWAFMDIEPDEEEEPKTPRALALELEEPAESFHAHRFVGCEPQEKRTTFIALGSLRHSTSSMNRNDRNFLEPNEHPAAHRAKQLVQLIHSLKEKVKLYEDAFEQRYGYRPSHHQKMDDRNTKRVLMELARTRKELKQLKERFHLSDIESLENSDVNDKRLQLAFQRNPSTSSVEQTVVEIQEHLAENRELAGRPEAVEELSSQEVLDEKLAIQRALLYVESLHGRPSSHRHKDILRPLYDRYRTLKRMIVRSGLSRSKEEIAELAPILEHETLEFSNTSGRIWHRHSAPSTPSLEGVIETPRSPHSRRYIQSHSIDMDVSQDTSSCTQDLDNREMLLWKRQKIALNLEENLHALPLNQLVEQQRQAREEKRRLRRTIREMEADLLRKGSAGHSSNDDSDSKLEPIYAQYRHARAKLRLLEALVAKHDGSATL